MMRVIYLWFAISCLLLNTAFATDKNQNEPISVGTQSQGTIKRLSLEEGYILIDTHEYALASKIRVINKDEVLLNVSVLQPEQIIEYWVNNADSKINPTLDFPVINKIKVHSGLSEMSITH